MVCGNNGNGRLGNGLTSGSSDTLVSMDAIGNYDKTNAVAISCGGLHTAILLNTGEVMGTGRNYTGQLGDGTGADRSQLVTMEPSNNYKKNSGFKQRTSFKHKVY